MWYNLVDKSKIRVILVLPSYFESFGLVAIRRIPVICRGKGFTKEMFKDCEMGFVCRCRNNE